MIKTRITKTLTLDSEIVKTVETMAHMEKRSFTRQIELILEKALSKKIQKMRTASGE